MARVTPSSLEDEPDPTTAGNEYARRRIGYIPEFDGLRGVAALFVVMVHLFMIVIPNAEQLPNEIPGTFVFMDMFFVLSGFLITSLLLKAQNDTGEVGLGGFYRRRAMRLLPALYTMLIVHALYAWSQGAPNYPAGIERSTVLNAAFYGLNFKMNSIFAPIARGLTQLWSLGVEEQFYVIWPLIVILVLPVRRRLSTVVTVLTVAILGIATYRFTQWNSAMSGNTTWMRLYTHTDTRADSLLVGALLGYLWVHDVLPPAKVTKAAAYLSIPLLAWLLIFVKLSQSFAYKGGFTLMAVAWAAVILACIETDFAARPFLRWRVVRALGEVSYGIYLWHVPLQYVVRDHFQSQNVVVRVVLSLIFTAIAVALSWYLVERPFLRWKDRIERRKRDQPPVARPSPAGHQPVEPNQTP